MGEQELVTSGAYLGGNFLSAERILRESVPVFVSSFNQPTYLENTVRWLDRNGFKNVAALDQASTSPRLSEVYSTLEGAGLCRVLRLGRNLGPRATVSLLLQSGLGCFVFTDPDLHLPDPPASDFLSRLLSISRKYRVNKVGLALDISDSASFRDIQTKVGNLGDFGIEEWEQRFWEKALEPGVYRADVDTTFFLWNGEIRNFRSLRRDFFRKRYVSKILGRFNRDYWIDIRIAGPGFCAKHLPWYVDDLLPDEEREYYRKTSRSHSTWVGRSEVRSYEGPGNGR